ncbi:MAG: flavin reductase family protein, partial [Shinella sp.]
MYLLHEKENAVLDRLMLDPSLYRNAMSRYAGHVQIVTTVFEGERRGVTITAACSVSDNPAMILACVNASNPKNAIFEKSGRFALNTL